MTKQGRLLAGWLCLLVFLAACVPPQAAAPAALTPAGATEPVPSSAGADSPAAYSPQQLREDLQVLRTTLEEAHPGLYLYAGKAERDAQFDELEAQLDRAMTGIEFYRLIAPLVTSIHDGHTEIWPGADAPVYAAGRNTFLPLRLRFLDGQAYAEEVLAPDVELARGVQILAIDGLAVPEIVSRLLPYVSHDGRHDAGRYFYLGKLFPLYYGWGFEPAGSYELRTRDPFTGREATVALPAINVAEISGLLQPDATPGAYLNLEIRAAESIAIMTIGSFGDPGIRPFLNDSFARLRDAGVRDLIIDLRGNGGGGSGDGALLYSLLSKEPFRYYDHLGAVLDGPLTYLEYTDQTAAGIENILARMERSSSGDLRYPHWNGLDREQPGRPDAFDGNVYVLIDGGCGSSTTEFAAVAHYNRRAVFVGEETAGTYYGNNSGTMPALTLPHSGIVVTVPLFQFVMAVSGVPDDRGIPPDYAVVPTVEDFATGVDTQLAFALDLIRTSR